MVQTAELIETLGTLGLLERLDDRTRYAGLSNYQLLIDLVRDKEYERVQGLGDDFIPDRDLYNAVGAIYPLLDRKQKNEAIRAYLNQFDGINYLRVNTNHTPNIREPQLLADITIARPIYWPGLYDEKQLWKGKRSFAKLQKDIMDENGLFDKSIVINDFLVAYSLMRSDFTKFGDDYIKVANPIFLDRVMKGIVSLRFARRAIDEEIDEIRNDIEIDEGRNRLYELLPKGVHHKIESLRQEADWPDAMQFK